MVLFGQQNLLVHKNVKNAPSELYFTAAGVGSTVAVVRSFTLLEDAVVCEVLSEKVWLVGWVTNFIGFACVVSDASETLFHHFTGFVEFVHVVA